MKALVIEDNKITKNQICRILDELGFIVYESESGERGLDIITNENIDLIILDINLISMNGFSVCYFIRKYPDKYGIPKILMLTDRSDISDVLKGFKEGTDDYLKKPFIEEELVYRVVSLIRRSDKKIEKKLKHEEIELFSKTKQVRVEGKEISITTKEFKLLEFFMINNGIMLTKEKIYYNVWEREYTPENKTLDVCLNRIKKKIPILNKYLTNYKGIGYKFK